MNEIKSDTDKTKMILELLGLRFEDILKIIQNPDERVSHTSLSSIDILKTLEDIMEGAEYELLIESISNFIYSNIKKYPSVFFESRIKTLLGNYSDQILQSKNEKLIQLISLLFGDDFLRQNSLPVDLKDRFETWFVHYVDVAPNTSASLPTNLITDIYSATTHLSADTKAALKLVDNPKRIEEIGRVVVGYPVILQVRVMV
ncbi:hypothetical protein [Campylobacter iguaniorum]|uniref:hypothetical protein n=1 Tax=Campylobacter iguaniorum TaxID=1244531 RepID=UPI0011860C25|nr:hypothetical protein [Campylobacter iguaniorum]